jgi:hypothetical protein
MVDYAPEDWHGWFPPGLDEATAARIAEQWWQSDPHWAAYLAWTAYAATLPAGQPVSSVNTGAQSVSYSPAAPAGEYGAALARAEWHRSKSSGSLLSVPLTVGGGPRGPLADMSWWIDP